MKIKPIIHRTNQGHQIIIREARIDDAEELTKCIKSYLKSGFIPLSDNEFNPTIKKQEGWIRGLIENENNLLLVAETNNAIIGNIDITSDKRKMLNHTASIGMGILQEWRNQGIGSIMIRKVKEWSNNNPNIEILWLQVFSNNVSGIHLYNKSGFIENGRQKRFIKTMTDEYIDIVIMALDL